MNSIRVDIPLDSGLDLQSYLVQHPAATFFMRAEGRSLPSSGILDGDLLIVDRALCPRAGSVVVAVVNGEFELIFFNKNMSYEIWGVVTYVIHDVRAS